jgi:hypothetical protein
MFCLLILAAVSLAQDAIQDSTIGSADLVHSSQNAARGDRRNLGSQANPQLYYNYCSTVPNTYTNAQYPHGGTTCQLHHLTDTCGGWCGCGPHQCNDCICNFYLGAPTSQNCEGTWSTCTPACELASDRTFTVTQAQLGSGNACPTQAQDCQPGEGACPVNQDCEGSFSACTSSCESADDRVWTETQAQSGEGDACPVAEDCESGDGECVNTVVEQLKSLCDAPHTKQKWGQARHFSLKHLRQQCSDFRFRKTVRHLRTKLRKGTKKVDDKHWNRFCKNVDKVESVFIERCM